MREVVGSIPGWVKHKNLNKLVFAAALCVNIWHLGVKVKTAGFWSRNNASCLVICLHVECMLSSEEELIKSTQRVYLLHIHIISTRSPHKYAFYNVSLDVEQSISVYSSNPHPSLSYTAPCNELYM